MEKLEEIFWKEGKFVNANGKEVKPKSIGTSHNIRTNYPLHSLGMARNYELPDEKIPEKLEELQKRDKSFLNVNAYSVGGYEVFTTTNDVLKPSFSINFYKI